MNVDLLTNLPQKKAYGDGAVIVREGDNTGGAMYIIIKGKVGVYNDYRGKNQIKTTVLTEGNFFGEMTLFINRAYSFTAVAKGQVVLLEIDRMNVYGLFEKSPDTAYSVIQTLCGRLAGAVNHGADKTPALPRASSDRTLSEPAPEKSAPDSKPLVHKDVSAVKTAANNPDISGLFPEGHKKYELTIDPPPANAIVKRNYECPLCDVKFTAPTLRTNNLRTDRIEKDFRVRYTVNVDAVHYDIVTCPNCCYSAFFSNFSTAILPSFHKNIDAIKHYKGKTGLAFDETRDINAIFTGFYLTLICAPAFFIHHETTTAKVWLRLMWLYQDCEDETMENYAAKQAYEAYLNVYAKTDLGPDAAQQICITLGELCYKNGDISSAKKFFFQAKTSRSGKQMFADQAEDRLNDIRELANNPS